MSLFIPLFRILHKQRFHLVPELHFTLSLMLQSLSSFFWAAMLMMLIMYLVALYFTIATCCHDWGHCQAEVTLSSSKVSGQFVDGAADATQLRVTCLQVANPAFSVLWSMAMLNLS